MRAAAAADKAQILNYPDTVAAEAATIVPPEPLPKLDAKVFWLKPLPEVSPADESAA